MTQEEGGQKGELALGNIAKSSRKSGSPGACPDENRCSYRQSQVREDARKVNRPTSVDALGAVQSSLSQRRGKRFRQKAQVRMKTQFLACVLNLSELEYDLGGEKTMTLTNSERPREGRGVH